MFDVPFQYGTGWDAAADDGRRAGHRAERRDERQDVWRREQRRPHGARRRPGFPRRRRAEAVGAQPEVLRPEQRLVRRCVEDAYMPFRWGQQHELPVYGNTNCWKSEPIESYAGLPELRMRLAADVGRVADARRRATSSRRTSTTMRASQKAAGRLPRPLNNQLYDVDQLARRQQGRRERQPRADRHRAAVPRGVPRERRGPAAGRSS